MIASENEFVALFDCEEPLIFRRVGCESADQARHYLQDQLAKLKPGSKNISMQIFNNATGIKVKHERIKKL